MMIFITFESYLINYGNPNSQIMVKHHDSAMVEAVSKSVLLYALHQTPIRAFRNDLILFTKMFPVKTWDNSRQ